MMLRTPRRIGHDRFQICPVIEQRIIPSARVLFAASLQHERLERLIAHPFFMRKQLVQEYGADVRLKIERRLLISERHHATCRSRTDARQLQELIIGSRQLPFESKRTLFSSSLERQRASVVSKPLPMLEH